MTSRSETPPTSSDDDAQAEPGPQRWRVGGVVAGSLAAGLVAALILPFLPVGTVDADFSTAMVLIGFSFVVSAPMAQAQAPSRCLIATRRPPLTS